jgi:hypothetical protein
MQAEWLRLGTVYIDINMLKYALTTLVLARTISEPDSRWSTRAS